MVFACLERSIVDVAFGAAGRSFATRPFLKLHRKQLISPRRLTCLDGFQPWDFIFHFQVDRVGVRVEAASNQSVRRFRIRADKSVTFKYLREIKLNLCQD